MSGGIWKIIYPAAIAVATPVIKVLLAHRVSTGKEDRARLPERFGLAAQPRPAGPLIWIHGASVGEATSVRPLIDHLLAIRPDLHVVLTTGTMTSARRIAAWRTKRLIHQVAPLDRAAWVDRFLDHWRPELAIWIDSEFWPNMIWRTAGRQIPLLVVNGRISAKSEDQWRWAPGLIGSMLACFDLCLGQSRAEADRFTRLGAPQVDTVGNLKYSAAPLEADAAEVAAIAAVIGSRPRWAAASTHPGEETAAITVHRALKTRHADLLTLIVPRHPDRGAGIAAEVETAGLRVARRSRGEQPTADTDIYLVDTLGELGLIYRLIDICFIGGSYYVGLGGHNPIEAAQLDCAILQGPQTGSFEEIGAELADRQAVVRIADEAAWIAEVGDLLAHPDKGAAMAAAAKDVAQANRAVIDKVVARVRPFLDR